MRTTYLEPTALRRTFMETVDRARKDQRQPKYDPDDRPAAPVNVRVDVRVQEQKNRLEFKAIARCDPLTPNTCQADIAVYVFQQRYTNAGATPQEQDAEGKNVIHTKRIDAKEVFDSGNDEPHAGFKDLQRPKSWYIQVRARIKDKHHRLSDWSAWTTPVLPQQVALPKPPAPTITDFSFLKDSGNRETKYEGRVTFTAVRNWDVPGGDKEDDMSRYIWKVQVQIGGAGPWRILHKGSVADIDPTEDDGDGDSPTSQRFHFLRVHRRHRYRCKMRSVDRWNRRGDWTAWYPSTVGVAVGADTPPSVTIIRYIDNKKRRGIVWEAPEDATDVNNDIKKIEIQMAKDSAFSNIVEKHTMPAGHAHYRYLVPRADWDANHFIRIRTVDGEGDKNQWQPSASGQLLNGTQGDETSARSPGEISKWAGPNIPAGALRANGASHSVALYPALFAELGYLHGGSGPNFNVPDLRGRHAIGAKENGTLNLGADEGLLEAARSTGHGHLVDTSQQSLITDGTQEFTPFDQQDNPVPSDSQGESTSHSHSTGLFTDAAGGTQINAQGGGLNDASRMAHTHFISGYVNPRDVGHDHGHGHQLHGHGHGHAQHGHGHGHGQHGHGHGHDSKTRPHKALHFIIWT